MWIWIAFAAGVVGVLLVDLFVFHRSGQAVAVRQAAYWTIAWMVLAVAFTGVVWAWRGSEDASAYLAGYLIERSLSVDNVFVLAVILAYFAVPTELRQRALLYGVLGALVLRGAFIAGGAVALEQFAWTTYVLGVFLVATGLRLAVREIEARPDRNPVVRALRRVVPMTEHFHEQRLVVRLERRWFATPMLAVLLAIATTDVAFAVDSVPAVFAVTDDAFLVFAANAFSVLGMLALYFLLVGMMARFRFLRPGLAAILVFVGAKMLLDELYHVPAAVSLVAIVTILAVSLTLSVLDESRSNPRDAVAPARTRPEEARWKGTSHGSSSSR